jgi:hypothetical protein
MSPERFIVDLADRHGDRPDVALFWAAYARAGAQ